jgi:hypothetical protein
MLGPTVPQDREFRNKKIVARKNYSALRGAPDGLV